MSKRIEPATAKQILTALCLRFGIAESVFDNCELYQGAKGKVYLHKSPAPEIKGAAIIGLHIATVAGTIKPSTYFIQTFGRLLSRNVLTVSHEEARKLIAGQELALPSVIPADVSDGYIALSCGGQPFMCGFLKEGELRNMLPKSRRRVLHYI